MLDLPAARIASLRAHLDDHLSDPRHARGIRHEHTATAAIAAAALLSAHRLPAGMAAYAAGLSQQALAVFGARWSVRSGSYVAPSESSFRRFLHGVPPGALGAAVGSWLTGQAAAGALDARSPAADRPPGRPRGAVMAGRRRAGPAAELVYADAPGQQIKMLGSLPWCTPFAPDRHRADHRRAGPYPRRRDADVGQAVEAMVCNRLTSPAPLVHVQDWAGSWAVEEVLGIPALALNDDKLGRSLDAIAPRLEEITGAVALRAIGIFGIDISQMHWDMTSFSLHGAYPDTDGDYPAPSYGHPKDRREDLLQIQAGIAAAGDGGIPVFTHAYSGGAAEISQVIGAMNGLKKIAGTKKFLLVGDSKLISYDNVAAIGSAGCTFLAPASKLYVKAAELAACDLGKATAVDYVAGRDQHKRNTSPEKLGRWYVLEDDQPFWIRNSKRKSDPPIRLRRIFVHSSARADAALTNRTRKLTRAKEDLDRLVSGLGGRFYPDEQKVAARIKQISLARKVGPYLRYSIGTAPAGGPGDTSTGQVSRQAAGTPRRPDPARRTPGRAPAAADPANPPSPGGSTKPPSTPKPPPTAGTPCSTTSTPPRPQPRCCCATKPRKPSNAGTATSKARWRSLRCS